MESPEKIEVIGQFLAMRWKNRREFFMNASTLRANSPSAEQAGESDIFGQVSGGSAQQEFADISIHKLEWVGNYAIRILFSDGHGSGIYSWDYLLGLEDQT